MWDESLVSGLIDNQLSEAERQQTLEQLASDPQLQELCDDLQQLSSQLRQLPATSLRRDLSESIMASIASTTPTRAGRHWYLGWGVPLIAAASLLLALLASPAWLEKRRQNQSDTVAWQRASDAEPEALPAAAAPQGLFLEEAASAQPFDIAEQPQEPVRWWISDELAAWLHLQRQQLGDHAHLATRPIIVLRLETTISSDELPRRRLLGYAALEDSLWQPPPELLARESFAARRRAESPPGVASIADSELAAAATPRSPIGIDRGIGGGKTAARLDAVADTAAAGEEAEGALAEGAVADGSVADGEAAEGEAAEGGVAVLSLYSELPAVLETLREQRWVSVEQIETITAQAAEQLRATTTGRIPTPTPEPVDPWVWLWLDPPPGGFLGID
jgi:hypothetical protein